MGSLIGTIGTILVIADFIASLAFCVTYHVLARWWKTEFGKSLMIYQILMTLTLGLAIPRIIFGISSSIFEWARLIVFAVLPIAVVWRMVIMIKAQRKASEHDEDRK
jgi:cytochrome bd-type quinol oxidase subunit 2